MRPTLFLTAAFASLALSGAARAQDAIDGPPAAAIMACAKLDGLQREYDCINKHKAAADDRYLAAVDAWPTESLKEAALAFAKFRDAECRGESMSILPAGATDFEHLAYYEACQAQWDDTEAARLRRLHEVARNYK